MIHWQDIKYIHRYKLQSATWKKAKMVLVTVESASHIKQWKSDLVMFMTFLIFGK